MTIKNLWKLALALSLLFAAVVIADADADADTDKDRAAADKKRLAEEAAELDPQARKLKDALAEHPEWLQVLYAERDYDPVWSKDGAPSPAFDELIASLKNADERGIDVSAYPVARVETLRRAPVEKREIGASRVFADYALDLLEGRSTPLIEIPDDFDQQREIRKAELLLDAYARERPLAFLDQITPDNFIVERLLDTLARYREMARAGGWPAIAFDERTVEIDAEDEAIPLVRERLRAEGFLTTAAPENPNRFDQELETALKAFQRSRSMLEDGIIGPNTIEALNETAEDLVDKLVINVERARWLPSRLGERAAFVNIADYTLRLLEDGKIQDRIAVVVGKDQHQTPVFAEMMQTVVINPYWNIPLSILRDEIAPKMVKDPGYLASQNMEVLAGWDDGTVLDPASIDWQAAARGEIDFRVRQKPGEKNALGRIKFLFPNQHAVYLHDTPADALFARDKRAFSHGCIRVEEPAKLAGWVFKNHPEWDRERVEAQWQSLERVAVALEEEIPVYITYFTAWTDPDGQVSFARDLYDRDPRVRRALVKEKALAT